MGLWRWRDPAAWPNLVNGSDLCFWHLSFEVRWCLWWQRVMSLWRWHVMLMWRWVMDLWRSSEERRWELCVWRGKKKKMTEREGESTCSWSQIDETRHKWVPSGWVKLQKCHITQFSITWKHLKYVFSFYNSSLKNQRIEWCKQKLKTNPNKPFSHGTHQFWAMGNENRVMGDGKQQIQTTP